MTQQEKTPGKTPGQIAYEADEKFENIPWWNLMDSTKQNYEHIAAAVASHIEKPLREEIERLTQQLASSDEDFEPQYFVPKHIEPITGPTFRPKVVDVGITTHPGIAPDDYPGDVATAKQIEGLKALLNDGRLLLSGAPISYASDTFCERVEKWIDAVRKLEETKP